MKNPGLPEAQETAKKSNRFLLFVSGIAALITAAVAGVYAWTYLFNPCELEAVTDASAFLVSQLKTYDAQYQFTTSVYRSGLDAPVDKLQQIYMDTQAMSVPVCMHPAKDELLSYMSTVIRAFQAFGAGEADTIVSDLVDLSYVHYDNFRSELEAVNKCAPYCLP